MIQDYQTNKVYLAKGLSYYMPLSMLIVENLKCHGIDFAWLPRTENDNYIWARDYMPIQLERDLFLQYQYNPDYLKRYRGWIPPYKAICKDLGLNCITTDIVMDGGNVIQCGNKVIMTDKIFKENPQYSREALVDELENLFFAELVIIPWDRYEMYGHADGMVRWIDGDRVLINNYGDFDPSFRKKLVDALSPHFQVEELAYRCTRPSKFSWAFLNYLQVKDCIFVPWMPISEAHEAMSRMNELFPDKKVRHIGPFEDIVHMGGALHCVSWNILADPAPKPQEEA